MRPNYGCRSVFTSEEEMSLKDYLITSSKMNYGLSTKSTRQLAYEMAVINSKTFPQSWHNLKMAGEDWLYGFMKRHPDLSIRKPEACSLSRSTSFNKYNIDNFFAKLREVYSRYECFANGSRVYNLDETTTSTVQKPQKVIAKKGFKQVNQTTSSEKGTHVTTCCIINALGSSIPPAMVFPRTHFKSHMISEAPPGTLGLANPSGWMTNELFVQVMKHFIKHTCSSKENPTLLIYDNHESHLSIEVLDLAKVSGVTILTLHPHCSHKLQPLDVGVFSSFKAYYYSAMDSRLLQKPGVPLTIYDVAGIVNIAHQRSMTPSNISSGFKKSGIFPFDANIFNEDDFAPSYVTDRPNKGNEASDATLELDEGAGPSKESGQPKFLSPQLFQGYPKAEPRKDSNRGRKKGRCMIATDTPEKETLLQTKRPKKLPKTKLFYEADTSSTDEEPILSDHSSDDVPEEESIVIDPDTFKVLKSELKLDNFVLVEFNTASKKYYIGKITSPKDIAGDFEISYLRRKEKTSQFVYPPVPDIATVAMKDIKVVLPEPRSIGKTKRQSSYLYFDVNFDLINVS